MQFSRKPPPFFVLELKQRARKSPQALIRGIEISGSCPDAIFELGVGKTQVSFQSLPPFQFRRESRFRATVALAQSDDESGQS